MRAPLLALVILSCLPTLAAAQTTVQVRLSDSAGRPVDGSVQLTGQRGSQSCRTTAGRCTLRSVTGGDYQVSVSPMRESAPPPHSVRVPASGAITVALATQPGATTSGRTPVTPTTTTTTPSATPGLTGRNATNTVVQVETRPGVTSVPTTTMTVREELPGPDLCTGATTRIRGSIVDAEGRPADATLIVKQGTRAVGHGRSTAGRFTLYDLPLGSYVIEARSVRNGRVTQVPVTVGPAVVRSAVRLP